MYEFACQVFLPVAQPQLIQKTYCIIPINKEHNDEHNSVGTGKWSPMYSLRGLKTISSKTYLKTVVRFVKLVISYFPFQGL